METPQADVTSSAAAAAVRVGIIGPDGSHNPQATCTNASYNFMKTSALDVLSELFVSCSSTPLPPIVLVATGHPYAHHLPVTLWREQKAKQDEEIQRFSLELCLGAPWDAKTGSFCAKGTSRYNNSGADLNRNHRSVGKLLDPSNAAYALQEIGRAVSAHQSVIVHKNVQQALMSYASNLDVLLNFSASPSASSSNDSDGINECILKRCLNPKTFKITVPTLARSQLHLPKDLAQQYRTHRESQARLEFAASEELGCKSEKGRIS